MTRLSEKVDELVAVVRLATREYEKRISTLENEVRDQRLIAETARETVRKCREQGQKTRKCLTCGRKGWVDQDCQCAFCAKHTRWRGQKRGELQGGQEKVSHQKECYNCGGLSDWLSPDGRCGGCTALTAEQVTGEGI